MLWSKSHVPLQSSSPTLGFHWPLSMLLVNCTTSASLANVIFDWFFSPFSISFSSASRHKRQNEKLFLGHLPNYLCAYQVIFFLFVSRFDSSFHNMQLLNNCEVWKATFCIKMCLLVNWITSRCGRNITIYIGCYSHLLSTFEQILMECFFFLQCLKNVL